MMLEPSIDKLLDQVDSKYSLVVLEAKRAHELRDKERPTKEFKAVKRTLQALEEIADGTVKIHPAPELKRETLVEKRELERLQAKMKEQLIKEQIAKEEAEEEAKQKIVVRLKQLLQNNFLGINWRFFYFVLLIFINISGHRTSDRIKVYSIV